MGLVKSIFSMLLLAVWLPATVHCELESIGLIPVDECCTTEAGGENHSESACKILEDSSYKTECAAALPNPPETKAVLIVLRTLSCFELFDPIEAVFASDHLPQFVIRTSLPIRGPSIAA